MLCAVKSIGEINELRVISPIQIALTRMATLGLSFSAFWKCRMTLTPLALLIGVARRGACRRMDLGILVGRFDGPSAVAPAPTFQILRYPEGLEISESQITLTPMA